MAPNRQKTIITPQFRAAFVSIFEAEEPMEGRDGAPRYSVTMLFPKSTNLDALKKLAGEAAAEKWSDPARRPQVKSPFRDGDTVTWPGFAGHTFAKAWSLYKPGVVDQNLQMVIDPSRLYPGVWLIAQIGAFAYANSGNNGVGFNLYNLQIVRDDTPFLSRPDAAAAFQVIPGFTDQKTVQLASASTDEFAF